METTNGKSLEECFAMATEEQRQLILSLLKEKAGYPTMKRKRHSGSHNEPEKPTWIPHKNCDNCSLSNYQQDVNEPTNLVQGCPYYPMRQFEESVERLVCLKWANRRFAIDDTEDEIEDGE
jgi:hypothetical protein